MSNENNEYEILSAYFDGELTSADQQSAEQVLEDSVTARREIDEIAELSELVKSLPTASAPTDLLPAVLRQAERETLLPATAAAPATAPKQKSRTLITMLAGVAAAAAAIVVTIQFLPPSVVNHPETTAHHESPDDNQLASNKPATVENLKFAESVVASADQDEAGVNRALGKGLDRLAAAKEPAARMPMASPKDSVDGITGPLAFRSAGRPKLDQVPSGGSKAAGFGQGNGSAPSVSSDSLSMNSQLLRNAQRGDEFRYFTTEGTKVTTYMVTVVDVNRALDKLELLLAENKIHTRTTDGRRRANDASEQAKSGEGSAIADRDDAAQDKDKEQASTRMIAVYVETTSDQFNSAMRAIYEEEMLADLHVKPPVDESQIEVADLGRARRRLFSRQQALQSGEKKRTAEIELAEAKPAAAPVDAPTPAAKPGARKTKQKAPEETPTADDKAAANNRPAGENSPAVGNKNGSSPKQENRDKADKRFIDEELNNDDRASTPSFQLRVQLAPLPTIAEKLKAAKRMIGDELPAKPQTQGKALTTSPSLVRNERKLQRPADRAAPVRILFVLRKATGKNAPQP